MQLRDGIQENHVFHVCGIVRKYYLFCCEFGNMCKINVFLPISKYAPNERIELRSLKASQLLPSWLHRIIIHIIVLGIDTKWLKTEFFRRSGTDSSAVAISQYPSHPTTWQFGVHAVCVHNLSIYCQGQQWRNLEWAQRWVLGHIDRYIHCGFFFTVPP